MTAVGDGDDGNVQVPQAPVGKIATRQSKIFGQVQDGHGSVSELARSLRVSEATIRRDLRQMGASGLLARTYGGAIHVDALVEPNLREKEQHLRSEKRAIAEVAAALVADGDTVLLDAGSTVGYVADQLRVRQNLTIVTNGLNSLITLRDVQGINLFALGGQVRTVSQATVGSIAEDVLRRFHVDKAFLGADGVDPELGISCPSVEQAYLKGLMAQRASEVYVLADHSKLRRRPFPNWATVERPYTLITDSPGAGHDAQEAFRSHPECTLLLASREPRKSSPGRMRAAIQSDEKIEVTS